MGTEDLSSFIEDVTGESYLRVQENLGDGFVRLRAKEAQRRQAKQDITCFEDVLLELLRNARDASATVIFIASWKEAGRRFITAIDDGSGIPEHLHSTVFEPFVTSKLDTFHEDRWGVHGRGMALYSIKENVEHAEICFSQKNVGTALALNASTSTLGEKIDQSTLPYIHFSENGEQVMRGPRNLIRVAMEFALDSKDNLNIYFGSPVEIAATLFNYQTSHEEECSIRTKDSVVNFLQYIYDPDEFSEQAEMLGLPLSSRSARRIINHEIDPLSPLLNHLTFEKTGKGKNEYISNKQQVKDACSKADSVYKERRKLKVSDEDIRTFQTAIEKAFSELAHTYYLEQSDTPQIRTGSEKITITIPFKMTH